MSSADAECSNLAEPDYNAIVLLMRLCILRKCKRTSKDMSLANVIRAYNKFAKYLKREYFIKV